MADESQGPSRSFSALSTLSYCVASDDGELRAPRESDPGGTLLPVGTSIQDRYELRRELGRGGMGCVYLARDDRLDRLVAIKVVATPSNSCSTPLDAALAYEARLGAGLNHPAIAAVYDFGFHQGRAFTVFEYVDGDALRELLLAEKTLPLDHALPIIGSLARALDFAHSRGILHRDLKPDNVMIGAFGEVYVVDWGIAVSLRDDGSGRLPLAAEASGLGGTPAYMAPEMLDSNGLSERTDVYLLGAILYEIVAGRPPHLGSGIMDFVKTIVAARFATIAPRIHGTRASCPSKLKKRYWALST